MTTILDVGALALRKLRGERRGWTPSAGDRLDIKDAAQAFYDELVASVRLTPVVAEASEAADEDTQVLKGAYTITFPTAIEDDDDRAPYDLSIISVVTAGAEPDTRIYDARRGEWVSLVGLEVTTDAPLVARSLDGLACCFAKKLAELDGVVVPPQTELGAARFMSLVRTARNRGGDPEYF